MADLTAKQILGTAKPVPCDNKAWGGTHYVRVMNALQRAEHEAAVEALGDGDGKEWFTRYMAVVVLHTCCDKAGKLLFNPDQLAELTAGASFDGMVTAYQAAAKANLMSKDDQEELAKNS